MAFTEDMQVKVQIAERAVAMFARFGMRVKQIDMLLDIEFVNQVCPLRLRELLEADDLNFSHDIGGIYKNFNRETKQFENCFRPRFAGRQA